MATPNVDPLIQAARRALDQIPPDAPLTYEAMLAQATEVRIVKEIDDKP